MVGEKFFCQSEWLGVKFKDINISKSTFFLPTADFLF